jgi:hypothetical protein
MPAVTYWFSSEPHQGPAPTFNQPKSLLASARFKLPMRKCAIRAKLHARIEKHASSEQTWRRHINPCQPCVLEPGCSGLKVLMHPQKTLIQIRFSHKRSRNVPLRGCMHLFYRGRDGMLGGEPPARKLCQLVTRIETI